ncbi:hypothetical protein [Arsukibacterium sp.]|uniref:hypothetical protein n=1 Tax=Arsukibacterium sp. TaxID=1977258 RepID=UPI00356205F0
MLADKVHHAGLLLGQIKQHIEAEDYLQATTLINEWQLQLQQLIPQLTPADKQLRQNVQQLSEDFLAMLPVLQQEQAKLKDSISQIAAVKSENKISKTYQID